MQGAAEARFAKVNYNGRIVKEVSPFGTTTLLVGASCGSSATCSSSHIAVMLLHCLYKRAPEMKM
jgi:hypothetical protein